MCEAPSRKEKFEWERKLVLRAREFGASLEWFNSERGAI